MMMTVPMDKTASPSSGDLVQRLYKKNIELENGLRKSAKSRVPSDPNVWLQMRENYEIIILENHDFSEKHEVEVLLWQLHYRRIEEFRGHIHAVSAATGSTPSKGENAVNKSDRIRKIRTFFKSFLSEATGFYHELIQKIRSKYGLSVGYFSEYPGNQVISANDEEKLAQQKKGLLSCHRCLIYLGDVARYKGLYGEGDSTALDHSAASSYYIQATDLWPSSGNPHHQLAILASYTGDELTALYRYFRSLAVDSPFSTARDNLIIAFEKNRQNYSLLPGNTKVPPVKVVPSQANGRGKGRGGVRGANNILSKDATSIGLPSSNDKPLSIPEMFKVFSIRFVRLNGILYTCTSLETFEDNFTMVVSGLNELISSGPEEISFGPNAAESGQLILRLITILIFTVHNANKESEGQSYAEILQRSVLLQNASVAIFEFAGHIVKRSTELHDVSSSYLLPGIMVFMEWLACNPDVASSGSNDEKQSRAQSFFWEHIVNLLNKLSLSGFTSIGGDDDDACFSNMTNYEEDETENRHALWEDFELRGFSPLAPAQLILDFSSKHHVGSDLGKKEKKFRIQRIFAAGRSILPIVRVNQQGIYFDSKLQKFVIASEFPPPETNLHGVLDASRVNDGKNEVLAGNAAESGHLRLSSPIQLEVVDYEEEEIVFKPAVIEKLSTNRSSVPYDGVHQAPSFVKSEVASFVDTISPPIVPPQTAFNSHSLAQTHMLDNIPLHHSLAQTNIMGNNTHSEANTFLADSTHHPVQRANASTSKWFLEQGSYVSDGTRNANISENGYGGKSSLNMLPLQSTAFSLPISLPVNASMSGISYGQINPSNSDVAGSFGRMYNDTNLKLSALMQTSARKSPVARPLRHSGPPPGFSQVQPKHLEYPSSSVGPKNQDPLRDDYTWLDGYQPSSTNVLGIDDVLNQTSVPSHGNSDNYLLNSMDFPFSSNQIPKFQVDVVNDKWAGNQLLENLKHYSDKQFQANQVDTSLLDQYQPQKPSHYYF